MLDDEVHIQVHTAVHKQVHTEALTCLGVEALNPISNIAIPDITGAGVGQYRFLPPIT
jgi:hypothetical protein